MIWYAPPAPDEGLTALKFPPDSHITIACGIAHWPTQVETVCCACAAAACWLCCAWACCSSGAPAAPPRDLGLEAGHSRRLLLACLLELRCLSLGIGAHRGDLVARGGDPLVEGDLLGLRLLNLGKLRRHLVAERSHAAGERGVRGLDPPHQLGPVGEVVEPLGAQEQLGRVGRVSLVDGHEAPGQGPQRAV